MLQTVAANVATLGIGHVVVQVGDLTAAASFYRSVLGLTAANIAWPRSGGSLTFATSEGQHVVLSQGNPGGDLSASAAHVGYAVSPQGYARILDTARAQGLAVYDYREDRPIEADNNAYIVDPSGNRIQLMRDAKLGGDGVARTDHVAIEVNDILRAESLFSDWLGWEVAYRVGWNTDDYLKAKSKGEAGMREAMPGSRYWNERYSPFESERRALRPCPQLYYSLGGEATLVVYLAARRFQISPDDIVVGMPRLGLTVKESDFDALAKLFAMQDLPFEGPAAHGGDVPIGASLYLRDMCGNFLEFATAK